MLQVVASIGAFIPGLFNKTLSYKAAKAAGFAIIALLVLALLVGAKYAYDLSVVNAYKAEVATQARAKRVKAEAAADAEAEADKLKLKQVEAKLEAAATEAVKADPTGAAKTVGPVTQSYYDTLRKEKH